MLIYIPPVNFCEKEDDKSWYILQRQILYVHILLLKENEIFGNGYICNEICGRLLKRIVQYIFSQLWKNEKEDYYNKNEINIRDYMYWKKKTKNRRRGHSMTNICEKEDDKVNIYERI